MFGCCKCTQRNNSDRDEQADERATRLRESVYRQTSSTLSRLSTSTSTARHDAASSHYDTTGEQATRLRESVYRQTSSTLSRLSTSTSTARHDAALSNYDITVEQESHPLVIAAIDIGTTFSTFAFAFRGELENDPLRMYTKKEENGQVPSCVLIKKEGEVFESFGSMAEDKYKQMTPEEKENWYFFLNFKMVLYGEEIIDENSALEDVAGNRMMALNIFSFCIGNLKKDLMEALRKQRIDAITDEDILWVLTVPAIWNDGAKRFMRKAAENAGLGQRLMIALEPEAASVYCRQLLHDSESHLQPGSLYLVLDAGGGTVDIAVHRISSSNEIEEIYQASGGPWGGINVNANFEHLLISVYEWKAKQSDVRSSGEDTLANLKQNSFEDYIDLMNEFETKKKRPYKEGDQLTVRIPVPLQNVGGIDNVNGIHTSGDKLRLDYTRVKELFDEPIASICSHLQELFQKDSLTQCNVLMMVGGFSDCKLLENAIQDTFPELNIINPDEACLAVVKGAVFYGYRPVVISQRICRYTYGEGIIHPKTKHCRHPETVTFTTSNGTFCSNIFAIHAKKGRAVKFGETTRGVTGHPLDNEGNVVIMLFASPRERPYLVTEDDCKQIGTFRVPVTGGINGEVNVKFLFGGTEIEIIVKDTNSGDQRRYFIDYP